jgi:hypothetical protein
VTTKTNTLRARLAELDITAEELAAIISYDAGTVVSWVEGTAEPTDEERVLLRFLASDDNALRRVGQLRRTRTLPLRGEGDARHLAVPYGNHDAGHVTGGLS